MENLDTNTHKVNGSTPKVQVAEISSWLEAQIKKGDMGNDGGRLRITSLNAMAEMVAADEANDAVSVLANIERLRERWARKHPEAKSDTAHTYATRAKTTIEAYLTWAAAPDKYDPRKVISKKAEPGAAPKKRAPARASATAAPVQSPVVQPPPAAPRSDMRTFPLGPDRGVIEFSLPPNGVTFNDVMKYAVHMATLATDFDIGNTEQRQVFGLMVRGGRE